jgi:hypothetical protein
VSGERVSCSARLKAFFIIHTIIEYITTLEGDIAERDRLLDAIRTELRSTSDENKALRQEIDALKKALLVGNRADTPMLPPPAPLPAVSAAAALASSGLKSPPPTPSPTSKSPMVTPNFNKDMPMSPRLAGRSFWGGNMGLGGITPVHTTLVPDLSSVLSGKPRNASLQENINPMLNGQAHPEKTMEISMPATPFDSFTEMNPFTMKSLDAYVALFMSWLLGTYLVTLAIACTSGHGWPSNMQPNSASARTRRPRKIPRAPSSRVSQRTSARTTSPSAPRFRQFSRASTPRVLILHLRPLRPPFTLPSREAASSSSRRRSRQCSRPWHRKRSLASLAPRSGTRSLAVLRCRTRWTRTKSAECSRVRLSCASSTSTRLLFRRRLCRRPPSPNGQARHGRRAWRARRCSTAHRNATRLRASRRCSGSCTSTSERMTAQRRNPGNMNRKTEKRTFVVVASLIIFLFLPFEILPRSFSFLFPRFLPCGPRPLSSCIRAPNPPLIPLCIAPLCLFIPIHLIEHEQLSRNPPYSASRANCRPPSARSLVEILLWLALYIM